MFAELRRGARLGRYELLVPIATGGMARVWAARQHGQRGFTKLVAIKTILPHLAREAEFERMFLDEARIASMIHHPNVCEIYELGDEGGGEGQSILYMAMEWVFGDSLAHLLRSGAEGDTAPEPIDLRVAARILAEAAGGLHAAHELVDESGQPMGVVHRDVSPHNILVGADGLVKVTDFGVAKALGQTHSYTVAGQIKGKIHYMAPEQVTGATVDRRSDVFSLGCVLYEATTGGRPFRGEQDHQVMHALLKGDYTPPGKLLVGYPKELERIITKALAPSPVDRYPTAEALRLALEEWLAATGGLVTAAHVGATVRQRLHDVLERRKERIREADEGVGPSGVAPAAIAPSGVSASGVMGPVGGGSESGVLRTGGRLPEPPSPPPPAVYDPRGSMSLGAMPRPADATRSDSNLYAPRMVTASGVSHGSLTRSPDDVPSSRYILAAALGIGAAVILGVLTVVVFVLVHRAPPVAPSATSVAATSQPAASAQVVAPVVTVPPVVAPSVVTTPVGAPTVAAPSDPAAPAASVKAAPAATTAHAAEPAPTAKKREAAHPPIPKNPY